MQTTAMFFAVLVSLSATTWSVTAGAVAPSTGPTPVQSPNASTPATSDDSDVRGQARITQFQRNLRIDDQTLKSVLPIEQNHRLRVNAALSADLDASETLSPRERRKAVRAIERETIALLKPHLTGAQLRRWRQTYRMRAQGRSAQATRITRATRPPISTHVEPAHYVDYGSKYYQNAANPQPQECD